MRSNRLQLNIKTDLLLCTTSSHEHQLPTEALSFGSYNILPSRLLHSLGAYFDANLSLCSHIDVIVAHCFAALRLLRGMRRYVTVPVLQTLATSLSLTQFDYCKSAVRAARYPDQLATVSTECCSPINVQLASLRTPQQRTELSTLAVHP
jgi:hypothetical protein